MGFYKDEKGKSEAFGCSDHLLRLLALQRQKKNPNC